MLYLLRSDLTDFAIEALWDEPEFGVKHWHDFSRIAIVSDHRLIRSATALFTPFFPAKVKIFGLAELETAKQWICADA
jgi:hypothetical protein